MKINTNLEDEFNLAPMSLDEEAEVEDETPDELQTTGNTVDQLAKVDKIEAALPQVSGLDVSDAEFDELANYGIQAHKDLMELAMNIEQRFAGDVASAAGNMLGHAIAAKTNKAKKKLDMISLQLKKQLADHKTKVLGQEPEELEASVHSFDRNDILRQLLNSDSQNTPKA